MEALTRRERQLVELVERGLSNNEISREMRVSLSSTKSYLKHVKVKTGLNRVRLGIWSFATRHGLEV